MMKQSTYHTQLQGRELGGCGSGRAVLVVCGCRYILKDLADSDWKLKQSTYHMENTDTASDPSSIAVAVLTVVFLVQFQAAFAA